MSSRSSSKTSLNGPQKRSLISQLTSETSITGAKYIGDYENPRSVRIFWICAFVLSILGCGVFAYKIYLKWYITPDIGVKILYESSITVPFPAITICPQSKIKQDILKYGDCFEKAKNASATIPSKDKKYFEMAFQLCITSQIQGIKNEHKSSSELNGTDIVDLMSEAQFWHNDTFIFISADKYVTKNFEQTMDRVMTSEGFCFTFNLLDYPVIFKEDSGLNKDFDSYKINRSSSWSSQNGYSTKDLDVYPMRLLSGKKNAVTFVLVQNQHDVDTKCRGPDQGFKVYWHMSNEIPSLLHRSMIVGLEKSLKLIMKATNMRSLEDLQRFGPDERRCYYDNENKLKFFKSYTKNNCELECMTDYLLKKCECVKFFMPRTSSTPVCNFTSLMCTEKAEKLYYVEGSPACNCYHSCTQIKYELSATNEVSYETTETLKAFGFLEKFREAFPTGKLSRLDIEFDETIVEVQENFAAYKIQHFISDCGGLLGLFMGCSLLSLIEIIFNIYAAVFLKKHKDENEVKEEKERSKKLPQNVDEEKI